MSIQALQAGGKVAIDRPPRQARARNTRASILRAAADEFARNGYDGTPLSTLLRRTRVSKGAFYFHFESKEALAAAVLGEMAGQWPPLVDEVRARGLDPLRAMVAMVDELRRKLGDPIVRGGIRLTADPCARLGGDGAFYRYWQRVFADQLRDARSLGLLLGGVDPDRIGAVLMGMLAGQHLVSDVLGGPHDLAGRVECMWSLLLPSIASPAWLSGWRALGLRRGVEPVVPRQGRSPEQAAARGPV